MYFIRNIVLYYPVSYFCQFPEISRERIQLRQQLTYIWIKTDHIPYHLIQQHRKSTIAAKSAILCLTRVWNRWFYIFEYKNIYLDYSNTTFIWLQKKERNPFLWTRKGNKKESWILTMSFCSDYVDRVSGSGCRHSRVIEVVTDHSLVSTATFHVFPQALK